MRRRTEEGRIKTKIRSLLFNAGWEVVSWWEQHGDYRIHKLQWDLACWGCAAVSICGEKRESAANGNVQMACWCTMTECAKYGFTVDFDRREGWLINPKQK